MSIRVVSILLAILVISNPLARSQGFHIVKDGQEMAVVVVHRATENTAQLQKKEGRKKRSNTFECNDQTATEVLVDWIEKITGVRLKIVSEAPKNQPAIYVGIAAIKAGLNLKNINSPTDEGLRIISNGKTKILISGQNETSTVKAVCRFLEELGCRYFMDNDLGEVYPRKKTLVIGKLNITEKSGFMIRKIWGSRWTGQNLWKVWNGAGGLPMSTGNVPMGRP